MPRTRSSPCWRRRLGIGRTLVRPGLPRFGSTDGPEPPVRVARAAQVAHMLGMSISRTVEVGDERPDLRNSAAPCARPVLPMDAALPDVRDNCASRTTAGSRSRRSSVPAGARSRDVAAIATMPMKDYHRRRAGAPIVATEGPTAGRRGRRSAPTCRSSILVLGLLDRRRRRVRRLLGRAQITAVDPGCYPWIDTISGMIRIATMFVILIIGLIAGPAVSL